MKRHQELIDKVNRGEQLTDEEVQELRGPTRGPASSFDPSKLPQPEFVSFRSEVEEARDEAEFNREMDKGLLEESQKAAVFRKQVKESIKRGEYTRGELEAYLNAAKIAGRSRNPDPEVPITREDIVYELRNAEFNINRDRLRNEVLIQRLYYQ